jgi:tRNA pseudouridine38-40 synthase
MRSRRSHETHVSQTTRLRLLIAYDGRPFRGWQSQATKDAVQDHVEAAFAKIVGRRVVVIGSGRTDAGVHALGQVAHATVPRGSLATSRWRDALNAHLPHEIRVLRATAARADFHAQFDARGKEYVYRIWNGPFLHPLEIGRAWFVPRPLDLTRLRECARLLTGTHDFAGFAANRGEPVEDTVRTIHRIGLARRGSLLTLRFAGDGFLYRMVRLLTGTLVRCAEGRAEPAFLTEILAAKGRRKTHFQAPAEGLYLARVIY